MPDLILNEEEQMLQTALRDFVDREIAPKAKESDERGEFQWEAWRGLADLGLTGLGVDVKYGGSGPAGYRQVSIAAEEVARGDASASVSWLAHLALGVAPLDRSGSDDQKERILPPLAGGYRLYWRSFGNRKSLSMLPTGVTNWQNGNIRACPPDGDPKKARDSAMTTDNRVPINEIARVSHAPAKASATTLPDRSGGNRRSTYPAMAPPPSALKSMRRSISDPW